MDRRNISTATIKSILVGAYAWLATISFGLVLFDILFAGLAPNASDALNEAADFLLFIKALTILAALGAIGSSMDKKAPRNYMAASLAAIILGFLFYMTFSPFLETGSIIGNVIRIILTGSTSMLAFIGFYKYCKDPVIIISYD